MPLELRMTRGASTGAPTKLDGRVVIGDPAVRLLTPDTALEDTALHGYLVAELGTFFYWLVSFTCTFEHDDELPFSTAWIRLTLASDGGKAIAHSMEPAKLARNRTIPWHAKLTVPCVLVGLELDGERDTEEIFCEAGNEGTREPSWKYFKTGSATIRGLQRMRFVARSPVTGGISATVACGVTASHIKFGRRALTYDMALDPLQGWLQVPTPRSA